VVYILYIRKSTALPRMVQLVFMPVFGIVQMGIGAENGGNKGIRGLVDGGGGIIHVY